MPRNNGNTNKKRKNKKNKGAGIVMPRYGSALPYVSGGGYHKDRRAKRPADQTRREIDSALSDYEEYDDWE